MYDEYQIYKASYQNLASICINFHETYRTQNAHNHDCKIIRIIHFTISIAHLACKTHFIGFKFDYISTQSQFKCSYYPTCQTVQYQVVNWSHRSHWHRAPTFRGPPKHLDLIYFCNILVISVMHLHILLKYSLKIAKLSALRANYVPFSNLSKLFFVCFPKLFFFKAARMFRLFQGPPNFAGHRLPKSWTRLRQQ